MSLENLSLLLPKMIENAKMEQCINSIYVYGSYAQDDFEKGYSDIDLWIIIKDCVLEERVEITKKIVFLFDKELTEYLDNLHFDSTLKEYHYHGAWYFTESEFIQYANLYPTRVIYPVLEGAWKSIYKNDYIDQLVRPTYEECLPHLLLDYELFVRAIEARLFTDNIRILLKYILRAIKKYLWITQRIYIVKRKDILNAALSVFPNNELLLKIKELDKKAKEKNYFLDFDDQLQLSITIYNATRYFSDRIKRYLIENNYHNISEHTVLKADIWHNFIWSFTEVLTDYAKMNKKDVCELKEFLTQSYYQIIRYYMYLVCNKEQKTCLFGKMQIPLHNSILNNMLLNYTLLTKEHIYSFNGSKFLLYDHVKFLQSNKLDIMTPEQICNYIEKKYLVELYKLYKEIDNVKHLY